MFTPDEFGFPRLLPLGGVLLFAALGLAVIATGQSI